MPLLMDATLNQQALPGGQYGFSATRLEDLGAAEYTLVTIVTDVSGSVQAFMGEMERALLEIIRACRLSPRSDNLLVRLVTFSDRMAEVHGFKMLSQCHDSAYAGVLRAGGNTALYDSAENAIAASTAYGGQLTQAGFGANAIVFVITDGMDNASKSGLHRVREALAIATGTEALESMVAVLIGVNVQDRQVSAYLDKFRTDAGFSQYVEIGKADATSLARLATFVSRSIAIQSRALGTGAAAKTLVF